MIEVLKLGLDVATMVGVTEITTQAASIVVGTMENIGKVKGICMAIGTAATAGFVSKKAVEYVNETIDETVNLVNDFKEKFNQKQKESKNLSEE